MDKVHKRSMRTSLMYALESLVVNSQKSFSEGRILHIYNIIIRRIFVQDIHFNKLKMLLSMCVLGVSCVHRLVLNFSYDCLQSSTRASRQ